MSRSVARVALEEPSRLQVVPSGLAFLRLPDGRGGVDAPWLTLVTYELLRRHERLLVLVESELLCYDRHSGMRDGEPGRIPSASADLVNEDTMARWREVDAVRHTLPLALMTRVHIASWSHFIDPSFAAIWRHLLAAFTVHGAFQHDALQLGLSQHRDRHRDAPGNATPEHAAPAVSLCQVEALAMQLRIGEVAGYHHQYGVGNEGALVTRLYAGAYADDGLTVESLVGHPPRRVYRTL